MVKRMVVAVIFLLFWAQYLASEILPCLDLKAAEKRMKEFKETKGPFASVSPNISLGVKAFDWRDKVVLSPVQSHLVTNYCAGCWALAAASAITDRMRIHSSDPKMENFYISAQEIIRCSKAGTCLSGGESLGVYQYMVTDSIPDETCNIYWGVDAECDHTRKCILCRDGYCEGVEKFKSYTITSYGVVTGEEEMMEEIMQNGPISCQMHAPKDFFNYTDGVLIQKTSGQPNLMVLIIGWGEDTDQEGKTLPYWIGKNSYGTFWGEDGHFRVPRSSYKGPEYTFSIEESCSFPII
ncbi:Cathepsin Z [Thelohanellus kitauei]|uniref:Cathepsin Z n=1 Tax=Thelohanellus kitauei TaxID=669202 RepID=A0A0C2JX18_THEKT|nr:Cathepsin Z [Thelohanellus kitauei]